MIVQEIILLGVVTQVPEVPEMAYGIVTQSGGRITVDSAPGAGATG